MPAVESREPQERDVQIGTHGRGLHRPDPGRWAGPAGGCGGGGDHDPRTPSRLHMGVLNVCGGLWFCRKEKLTP